MKYINSNSEAWGRKEERKNERKNERRNERTKERKSEIEKGKGRHRCQGAGVGQAVLEKDRERMENASQWPT